MNENNQEINDSEVINEPLVEQNNTVTDHTPVTSSLLQSNIFSLKKINKAALLDIAPAPFLTKESRYYYSKRVFDNNKHMLFQNISVEVFAYRALDIRAFDTLKIVLKLLQDKQSNKIEVSFKEMFDLLGYLPTSRNMKNKKELIARVLSLTYIQIKSEMISCFQKLSVEEFDKQEMKNERTGLWTIFDIEQIEDRFFIKCHPRFYELYKNTHYRIIDDNEYKLLKSDVEKVLYRYLLSKENGATRLVVAHSKELFKATNLSDYEYKEAMRKAKQALKKLQEHKIISGFHVDSSKRFNISLIAQQDRKPKKEKKIKSSYLKRKSRDNTISREYL